jgi:hypothetical protein
MGAPDGFARFADRALQRFEIGQRRRGGDGGFDFVAYAAESREVLRISHAADHSL